MDFEMPFFEICHSKCQTKMFSSNSIVLVPILFFLFFAFPTDAILLGIMGGENVTDWRNYGNTVQVGTYDPDSGLIRGYCVGSIIDPYYVLTTAHCFFPAGVHKPSNFSLVSMGTKYIEFLIPDERVERQGYPVRIWEFSVYVSNELLSLLDHASRILPSNLEA